MVSRATSRGALGAAVLVAGSLGFVSCAPSPLPERAPSDLRLRARRAAPPRPGHGLVVLEAEEESTRVYEVAGRGRGARRLILCGSTPCVVRLRLGRHDLAFVSGGGTFTRHAMNVSETRSVAMQFDAEARQPALAILGVPLVLLGTLVEIISLPYLFQEGGFSSPEGRALLFLDLLGTIAIAGGVAMVVWGAGKFPSRFRQWEEQ